MAADPEPTVPEQPRTTPDEPASRPENASTDQAGGLAGHCVSTLRQLSDIETELQQRMAEFERREQELDAQGWELRALAKALGAERKRLDQSQAELQTTLEQLDADRQQLAAQQAELARGWDELAAQRAAPQQPEENEAVEAPVESEPGPAADEGEAVALETEEQAPAAGLDADTKGESVEQQSSGLFVGGSVLRKEPDESTDDPQSSRDVIEADASGNVDTVDFSATEIERMRVLRRLGSKLSNAELIAQIRAERESATETAADDGKQRKSKCGRRK